MYIVYGTPSCSFCKLAIKELLEKKLSFQYIDLTQPENSEKLKSFKEEGKKSVPQIFRNELYIGGYDQLKLSLSNSRFVIKRDGTKEEWIPSKINDMAEWAVHVDSSVQWSSIVMDATNKLPKGEIKSSDIQKSLINSCLDKEDPIFNKVAGRLLLGEIRKSSLANHDFVVFYKYMVDNNFWRDMNYSDHDISIIAKSIDHSIDLNYGYATYRQFKDKYGLKNSDGKMLELPQYMYMGISMSMKEDKPLSEVLSYYKEISEQRINLPSPILSTTRTPTDAGVSCCLISGGDSLQGIEAAKHAAFMFTSNSAGIGYELAVRSPNDDVRNGYAKAGGKLPHYKTLSDTVKEVKQSNRGGSATVSFVCIDPEINTLLQLKLPRTPDERKIDKLDYSFLVNDVILKRAAKKQDIPLVSIKECPEYHSTFYTDPVRFEELIEQILQGNGVKHIVANAYKIVDLFLESRQEIGRYYEANIHHMNTHTPFNKEWVIRQSNLCLEIALPTLPYTHITQLYKDTWEEGDGLISLCFISAIDVFRTSNEQYENTCYEALSALDETISKMKYVFPQVEFTANAWRSVGVGMTNLAQKLASEGRSYKDVKYLHEISERHYYYLLKASVRLAKERGKFDWIDKTKWVNGWLPIDTYNKNVDSIVSGNKFDWEELRKDVLTYGVRFSTLAAHMPCESSSCMTNGTNGLYPIRYELVYKNSHGGNIQFFAPNMDLYEYELAWDLEFYDIANMYAIFQKFTDQAISADTYLDFEKYPDKKVSSSERFRNYLYWNKMGIKTMYYQNPKTGRGRKLTEEVTTDDCEACKF